MVLLPLVTATESRWLKARATILISHQKSLFIFLNDN